MITQKREIQTEIERNGWKIVGIDEYEWWENEVWEIESVWSPIGKRVFITFIVDPQILNDKNAVIAATVSPERTTYWSGNKDSFMLYLNNKWKEGLPDFISHLSKLRNQ